MELVRSHLDTKPQPTMRINGFIYFLMKSSSNVRRSDLYQNKNGHPSDTIHISKWPVCRRNKSGRRFRRTILLGNMSHTSAGQPVFGAWHSWLSRTRKFSSAIISRMPRCNLRFSSSLSVQKNFHVNRVEIDIMLYHSTSETFPR